MKQSNIPTIILTWKPGAWKSSMATEITKNFPHIKNVTIGDLARNIDNVEWIDEELKSTVKNVMKQNKLISWEIASTLIKKIIQWQDIQALIIDCAKSLEQLEMYQKMFPNNYTIYFDSSDKNSEIRIRSRGWEKRIDDEDGAFLKRIERFNDTMKEPLELMIKNNKPNISKIDSNGSMEKVKKQFIEMIRNALSLK